jgi:transposase InsO family protein
MCELVGVSRAGYYRHLVEQAPKEEEMRVRTAIQEIALAHRRHYGWRRITKELRARGMAVNHKRVGRLMREDNLLAIRRRPFVVTTDSQHPLEVYLNVAGQMEVTGINQLWVADITYIRLYSEFVYLAVILDRFSRRAIGWELGRNLSARLTIATLERAIETRQPRPGLVHHSDRGIQYAAQEYTDILKAHGIIPSMSRPANPWDNAACERFMRTLKEEEVNGEQYRDFDDLQAHLDEFIGSYYNHQRLHSALGYQTPAEFERQLSAATTGDQPGGQPVARLRLSRPKKASGGETRSKKASEGETR